MKADPKSIEGQWEKRAQKYEAAIAELRASITLLIRDNAANIKELEAAREVAANELQGRLAAQEQLEAAQRRGDKWSLLAQELDGELQTEHTRREEAEDMQQRTKNGLDMQIQATHRAEKRAEEAERRLSEALMLLKTQWHRAHNNCPDEGRKEDCSSAGCQAARAVLAEGTAAEYPFNAWTEPEREATHRKEEK